MISNPFINTETDLYCIFGNPVLHSKSPFMHNTLFYENKINAVYLAFNITDVKVGIDAIRELDIKGASITIPYKKEVGKYLDNTDIKAEEIGAVNTIVNNNGRLTGYNTDWYGGIESLKKYGFEHKKIGIIGAGGSAFAIGYGVKIYKGNLTIINRTEKKGKELASLLNCSFLKLDDIRKTQFDILINTTSVGMFPDIKKSLINKEYFQRDMIVMDIVYNPVETQFLKHAKRAGCQTINGVAMFVNQGAKQFEIWTGIKPTIDLIEKKILKQLQ